MPKTRTGKRTARFSVQIVEDRSTVEMFFDKYDIAPIVFRRSTGASGKHAYNKLRKILDAADTEAKG